MASRLPCPVRGSVFNWTASAIGTAPRVGRINAREQPTLGLPLAGEFGTGIMRTGPHRNKGPRQKSLLVVRPLTRRPHDAPLRLADELEHLGHERVLAQL